MSKSDPSSSLRSNMSSPTPEQKLWRGVLGQAYADAELPLDLEGDEELFIDQERARRFLRADAPHEEEGLRLVCDYADVPFDRVVTWARKHYAPSAQQDFEKLEARDAKEVEEIVKTIKDRNATTITLSEFLSPLLPLRQLFPLLQ